MRSPRRTVSRALLALVVAMLAFVPAARSLPGDPPVTSIAPADGATLAANPAGIPVTFGCPPYRKDVFGDPEDPITNRGDFEDYEALFSNSPAVDERGVLASTPYSFDGGVSVAADGTTCTVTLDTEDSASSPEVVGGRVFWQATRSCVGCGGGQIEFGPVRSFIVKPARIDSTVGAPRRVYAGYLTKFVVRSKAKVSGAEVTLQRRAGKRWRSIAKESFSERTELLAKLPKGRQRLRAVITTSGSSSPGKVRKLTVRGDRGRITSGRDDGRYKAKKGARVSFSVTNGGRTLRNFTASVTALCFGAEVQDNRFMILFAGIDSARIAPDGSVTGRLQTKSRDSEVVLSGRLRKRSFKGEVSIFIRPSRCIGERDVNAVRR